jgi:hypothetical protein
VEQAPINSIKSTESLCLSRIELSITQRTFSSPIVVLGTTFKETLFSPPPLSVFTLMTIFPSSPSALSMACSVLKVF